jgi:hypothetical protein
VVNNYQYIPTVKEITMKQKFKGEVLTQKKCINSILRFYSLASLEENRDGLDWYAEANYYSKELAARFNISVQQAVGLIAAFSPQAGWVENKRYAVSFLYAPNSRVRSQVQTDKAKLILNLTGEGDIYNALSIRGMAYKTKAFFKNILNPDIDSDVTIDRHAIASCIQYPDNVSPLDKRYGNLTKDQYDFFQSCYIKAAKQLDILPHQLQAIVWLTYRRLRSLQEHTTTTEWKPFINENPF